nr:unnamed protein product [Spirometra erinaceieuropaei]
MSHECEMLLRKMLVLNPSKRCTLTEIMKDKWLNTTFEENTLQPHKEELPDYSDPERIQFMMQLGFSRSDIHDSLTKQLFNNITATYILLGHRKQKTGSLGLSSGTPSIRSLSTDATAAGYLAGLKINGSGGQHRRHSTATASGSRQSSQPFSGGCHHPTTPTTTSGSGTPTASAAAGATVAHRTSFRRTTVSPVAAATTTANASISPVSANAPAPTEEDSGGRTVASQNRDENSTLQSPPKTAVKTTTGVLRRVSVGSMDSFNKQNLPSGSRNQPGFEYRSLRLPAETAAALTRDAFFANDFHSKSPSPGFGGGGHDASVTTSGAAAAAASNAYSRQGRGFLVPFARNVPERCTIQHVPPRETADRLALERPEGWSRLVRHPGTAANMDQKTTLADLYGQADSYWRGKAAGTGPAHPRSGLAAQPAARSPSEQSVISITSAATTTSMTAGVLDSDGERDDDEFVGAEEEEGDSTLSGGVDRRLSNLRGRRRGGTPQSLCETSRPLTKEKSSTLSEPSSSKKFPAPTTSNNANSNGLGFFRNLTMRISRR